MGQVALDLAAGRYPRPIYGRNRRPHELPPVFGFHSVKAAPFEALLRFLAENGYTTLTADAYLDWMEGRPGPRPERSLLLTFDDGMGQVYSVAWPLLERYGMSAVVFLIPGLVHAGSAARLGPTLREVWAGTSTLEDVESRDRSEEPLATWAEIRAMHTSGVIDFQAHSLSHNLVFTGRKRLGFLTPELRRSLHPNRLTMWEERRSAYRVEPPLGLPLYATTPRLAEGRRVFDDPGVREACRRHVEAEGGVTFFERPDWRKELEAVARRAESEPTMASAAAETEEERRAAIRADLAETKALIEAELPGKVVRHLAYPWGLGSRAAMEISRDVGYASNHWGRVDGRLANFVGNDPFATARIGEDFLPLLQGHGRATLGSVVRKKLAKNLGSWS